ncbi:MAG: hypothetical protein OEZ34_11945 [Spirochaetia bacterium]|nr:hypothetical protein [Spirochaetia bacterium]
MVASRSENEALPMNEVFRIPSLQGNGISVLFAISFFMILSGILLLYFFFTSGETVREIKLIGLKYLKEEDALEILSVKTDHSISHEEMERAALRLKQHHAVKDVEMTLGAGVLMITVQEKSCRAVLRSNEKLYDLFSDMTVSSQVGCSGVPLLSGNFIIDNNSVSDSFLEKVIEGLDLMKSEKPELESRVSEIRLDSKKSFSLYLTDPKIRVVYSGTIDSSLIKRMYAAVSYYEKQEKKSGWIDLSGQDAILVPVR